MWAESTANCEREGDNAGTRARSNAVAQGAGRLGHGMAHAAVGRGRDIVVVSGRSARARADRRENLYCRGDTYTDTGWGARDTRGSSGRGAARICCGQFGCGGRWADRQIIRWVSRLRALPGRGRRTGCANPEHQSILRGRRVLACLQGLWSNTIAYIYMQEELWRN
jgi:hypothetical protein